MLYTDVLPTVHVAMQLSQHALYTDIIPTDPLVHAAQSGSLNHVYISRPGNPLYMYMYMWMAPEF